MRSKRKPRGSNRSAARRRFVVNAEKALEATLASAIEAELLGDADAAEWREVASTLDRLIFGTFMRPRGWIPEKQDPLTGLECVPSKSWEADRAAEVKRCVGDLRRRYGKNARQHVTRQIQSMESSRFHVAAQVWRDILLEMDRGALVGVVPKLSKSSTNRS